MGRVLSISQMVEKISGLVGTPDLNDWETGFVENISEIVEERGTTGLTDRQVSVIQRIHDKNF